MSTVSPWPSRGGAGSSTVAAVLSPAAAAGSQTSKRLPFPGALVTFDCAVVIANDLADRREAEPGPGGARREKWLEQPLGYFFVRNQDQHR